MSIDVSFDGDVKEFSSIPNQCTICHYYINPIRLGPPIAKGGKRKCFLVFQCPNCLNLFISEYMAEINVHGIYDDYNLIKTSPVTHKIHKFNQNISDLSSRFVKIYNESLYAESEGLLEICGPGYRKALEILVKDYLIKESPDDEDKIKQKPLGQCIHEIDNRRIQSCAKRAVWLGNDETHYIRKWENKDLQDLKKLIELVVHYIEMEIIAEEYESDMV